LAHLCQVLGGLPDRRTGDNPSYSMEDIGLGAFSVFFTQCPSFLAHQKTMQQAKGQSNAQSLFHLEVVPSDNHIPGTDRISSPAQCSVRAGARKVISSILHTPNTRLTGSPPVTRSTSPRAAARK